MVELANRFEILADLVEDTFIDYDSEFSPWTPFLPPTPRPMSPLPMKSTIAAASPEKTRSSDPIEIVEPKSESSQREKQIEVAISLDSAKTTTTPFEPFAMIDSGASGNFIDTRLVQLLELPTRAKSSPIPLYVIDGRLSEDGPITQECRLHLVIGDHVEIITANITQCGRFNLILGKPWLKKHNPAIDWKKDQLTFSSRECAEECLPGNIHVFGKHSRVSTAVPPLTNSTPQIREISAAAFQLNLRHAQEAGLLYIDEIDRVLASTQSHSAKIAEEYQKPKQTPAEIVPVEFHEFLDVFDKGEAEHLPPHRPYNCKIDLVEGGVPPFKSIYGLTLPELEELKKYIEENLKKGFIQHLKSPAGAPIMFVKKKDGSLCLCVDYRGLNNITIKNRYPLPLPNEIMDRVQGAKYFSKFDLRSGYNLVRIADSDEWKTAFRTRYGHFEYLVMPFDLTNAPAVFQHLMNDIFRDLLDRGVIIYLDDILIYSKDADEHRHLVKEVLRRLRKHKMFCKPEKCEFWKSEIEYLGFVISGLGCQMDQAKVQAIQEWPIPGNVHDIQVFLSFANFYRRFIKSYAHICRPMLDLLKKTNPFKWSSACQKSFEELKSSFTSAPVLQMPDLEKPFTVEPDASGFARGAVLSQEGPDGHSHPIAFL